MIHQESSFRARARPWWRLLGVPVAPASSAYGYGQATDATWRAYVRSAGRSGARRAAVIQLAAELEPGLDAAELAALGWPTRDISAELIARMAGGLRLT